MNVMVIPALLLLVALLVLPVVNAVARARRRVIAEARQFEREEAATSLALERLMLSKQIANTRMALGKATRNAARRGNAA